MRPSPIRGVPRARGLPLVGNWFDFRDHRLRLQERVLAECGDLGVFRVGPIDVLGIASAPIAMELLVDRAADFMKSRGINRYARPLLGDGLLTSEGEAHKRNRKLIAPAFHPKRVAAYAAVMADLAERAAATWPTGRPVDACEEMMRLTLDIVARTLFDADVSGDDARAVERALPVAMAWVIETATSPLPLPLAWPTPRNVRMRRAVDDLNAIVFRIIGERRARPGDRGDVLSMLLLSRDEDDGSGMTDEQVRDEVMTLFLAGQETTANALAWAFHLLVRNPDVYARLQAEIDGALSGRTPTLDDLPRLPLALAVLKESMRLYPPAYMIGRESLRDTVVGGVPLRAGTVVFVNTHALHRRADYFDEPLRFDPDRFAPAREKAIPRGAYLPFGAGPRVCIGNHFALMEGQLLLAAIAQRVTFEPLGGHAPSSPPPAIEPEPMITLRPRGGVPVRVAPRRAAVP